MLVTARRLAIHRKWDEYEFLDFMSVGSVWFLISIWIGRFFAGAYLGTPAQLPWAVVFPSVYDARHPVQLYFSGLLLLVLIVLVILEKRFRFFQWYKGSRQSAQSGFVVGLMIFLTGIVYCVLRFFLQEPQKVLYSFPLEAITPFILVFGLGLILFALEKEVNQ
jgi:prolipoprotein diacylglyceryltransferase